MFQYQVCLFCHTRWTNNDNNKQLPAAPSDCRYMRVYSHSLQSQKQFSLITNLQSCMSRELNSWKIAGYTVKPFSLPTLKILKVSKVDVRDTIRKIFPCLTKFFFFCSVIHFNNKQSLLSVASVTSTFSVSKKQTAVNETWNNRIITDILIKFIVSFAILCLLLWWSCLLFSYRAYRVFVVLRKIIALVIIIYK